MIHAIRQLYERWRDILLSKPRSRLHLIEKVVAGLALIALIPLLLAVLALSAIVGAGMIWAAVPYIAGGALLVFKQVVSVLAQIPVWAGIIIILLMLILKRLNVLTRG